MRTFGSSLGNGLKVLGLVAVLCASTAALAQGYSQTNLVSDTPGMAALTDPNLVNAWGIVAGPSTPFWISDNGTGLSTLYKGDGTIIPLVVTVPPPAGGSGPSTPTGIAFNATTDFVVTGSGGTGPALFLFATEDGTISGWNSTADHTNAILTVDNSKLGAVYKGLALGTTKDGNFLYTTNFHDGSVEMYDANFQLVKTFTDTSVARGYAPFGIANIGGKLYVTFAKQDEDKHDDAPGAGHGYVDIFDLNGNLKQRLIVHGKLDSPWGVVWAAGNFGPFSHTLLVGNFGNGRINSFDPKTGAFLGTLRTPKGKPVWIDGLWGLSFGNDGAAGPSNVLYFTAGPSDEAHGLFGMLTAGK